MTFRLTRLFSRRAPRERTAPRLMAYCASNIGLGHYWRLLRVLEEVRRRRPEVTVLLVTDARDVSAAEAAGLALLQLPRFRFVDEASFREQPEALAIGAHALRELRAQTLLAAGCAYDPDVLLMDTNPHGKRDEALPLLKALRARHATRALLLMRDIPCPPGESFKLSGPAAQIRKHAGYYHRLLLAGDPAFFDAAEAYGWPSEVRARMRYVGFAVPQAAPQPRGETLAEWPAFNPRHPLVVAGFGGGWAIEEMLERLLRGVAHYRLSRQAPLQLAVAAGPALAEDRLMTIKVQAESLGGVIVERSFARFPQLLGAADVAVLQAGSTAFQLLPTDVPIVLVPRDYKSREQEERALRLAALPGVLLVQRDSALWDDAAEWIAWGLAGRAEREGMLLNFDGVAGAATETLTALDGPGAA